MSKFTIDNELFDRQTRTYGKNSVKKFSEHRVCIYGLDQLFASEVLKNLALSGFRHLYLKENKSLEFPNKLDLDNSLYYRDLNKSKFETLKNNILELNPTCIVEKYEGEDVDTIIILNQQFDKVFNIEKNFKGKLIAGYCTGINGFVFSNPKSFTTLDLTGETIDSHNITSAIFDDNIVTISTLTKHELSFGDKITFEKMSIESNTNIYNFSEDYSVKVINPYKFTVKMIKPFKLINGMIRKVVTETCINSYKSFEETINNPKFEGFDWETSGKIVDSYKINDKFNQHQIMPIISIIGSLVANEVIKFASNKFTPINQILTFNDSSLEKLYHNNSLDIKVMKKIKELNYCMVGCGAIGCELLKNLAMLKCASTSGKLLVTDPDHIEKSNLSRQFLFRHQHVGKPKSKVAANMVQQFSKINIETFEKKITPSDNAFSNTFFKDCNIIFNALDNLQARTYVDSLAFKYNLPLFESGTMGMKGNTQPVIPFVTETYSDSTDLPDESSFPVCTIKNFPNMIQHTIHWARDNFEIFNRAPTNIIMYLKDNNYVNKLYGIEKNQAIKDINLFGSNFKTWEECAEYSFNMWYKNFNYDIKQLLHSFPKDKLLKDGSLFWSHGKKCPKPLKFNISDEYHIGYLTSMTRILCNIVGIEHKHVNDNKIIYNITNYNLTLFELDKNKKEAATDADMKKLEAENINEETIIKSPNLATEYYPQEFEKDDDTNYHVKFITCCSNCRAENYKISQKDYNTTKGIAGKIIPAVATTTSIVSGLIILEMLKFVAGFDNIEDYRSYFCNLAINIFVPGEPIKPTNLKIGKKELNYWLKFEQTDNITLKEFIKKWSSVLDTQVNMIFSGSRIIYSEFTSVDVDQKLSSILEKMEINPFNTTEEFIISSDEYEDLPSINVTLRKNESIILNV